MFDLENRTLDEIQNGFYFDEKSRSFVCTDCGAIFENGEVFQRGERFFHAATAVRMHVAGEHKDRLNLLLREDNRYLTLTENQKELLELFGQGYSDKDAARKLNVSPSTIRHQRFMFREKAKTAKMYLALWEMASARLAAETENEITDSGKLLPVHGGATMIDERYEITEEENTKILNNVFESLEPLRLKVFSSKEKKKIITLRKIAEQFEKNRSYTEKEVNSILTEIYADFATIRRYLIEYGYMERTRDCSAYRLR